MKPIPIDDSPFCRPDVLVQVGLQFLHFLNQPQEFFPELREVNPTRGGISGNCFGSKIPAKG